MNENENKEILEKKIGGSRKILLLEDYPDFIKFYVGRLQDNGFVVVVEDDEELGVELAIKEKPDLIILDVSLPKLEDFWFIHQLKKKPEIANIPVIVLTDLVGEKFVQEAKEAGACDYLVREDFTFDQVIDRIKSVLE